MSESIVFDLSSLIAKIEKGFKPEYVFFGNQNQKQKGRLINPASANGGHRLLSWRELYTEQVNIS